MTLNHRIRVADVTTAVAVAGGALLLATTELRLLPLLIVAFFAGWSVGLRGYRKRHTTRRSLLW